MKLHVGKEFMGTSGGVGSLDDLEGADEPGLEIKGWVDVQKAKIRGREANHVTNREGHMATMHVNVVLLTVLSMGNGVISHLVDVTNKLGARCSCWVGRINGKGGVPQALLLHVLVILLL